jgi:hypothetical protein
MNYLKPNTRMLSAAILTISLAAAASTYSFQITAATALSDPTSGGRAEKAPVVVSGNNIYIVWGTDKGTINKNGELMFRVSTDGGKTF